MIQNAYSNYMYGAKFFPLVPIAWETSNQVAKVFGVVKNTYMDMVLEEFQSDRPVEFDDLIPSQGIERLAMRQVALFLSNQIAPLFEEFLLSTVLQYGLLTLLPSKISECRAPRKRKANPKPNQNETLKKISRIVISSLIFGMLHAEVAYFIDQKNPQHSMDQLHDRSWMQITGTFGAGLVYRSVYELSGQNLFAAWGTHAVYNYFYDLMTVDFWY